MDAGAEYHNLIEAVSNPERLSIIALLSLNLYSTEELAIEMDSDRKEIERHLNVLTNAKLISQVMDRDEEYFKFNPKNVEKLARKYLSQKLKTDQFSELNLDKEEERIISHYLNRDGTLLSIPTKSTKLRAILTYVIQAIDSGVMYQESEVNDILSKYYADTTTLRRLLIDYKLLDREKNGSYYWRLR